MNTPITLTVENLPENLRHFLKEQGFESGTAVSPLKDGGNNQVFRLTGGERDYVLKRYFQNSADPRDRFNTERVFYDLLWHHGVRRIPEPCLWENEARLGLFSFVPGRKLAPEEITLAQVKEAVEFIIEINAIREQVDAQNVASASEARFSIEEQVAGINQRVEALQSVQVESVQDEEAREFAQNDLLPAWGKIVEKIEATCAAQPQLKMVVDKAQRCLSPSDFGFHNALAVVGEPLRFFDFEYAGWDDPAKLVCDFFCQPQVPVSFEHWDFFTNALAEGLRDKTLLPVRARALLPAYQIKWCCIILNHFLRTGKARREFAHGASTESIKSAQLEKARLLLNNIRRI